MKARDFYNPLEVLATLILICVATVVLTACPSVPVRNQIQAAADTATSYANRTTMLLNRDLISIEEASTRLSQLRQTENALRTARVLLDQCLAKGDTKCEGASVGLSTARSALNEYEIYLLTHEKK